MGGWVLPSPSAGKTRERSYAIIPTLTNAKPARPHANYFPDFRARVRHEAHAAAALLNEVGVGTLVPRAASGFAGRQPLHKCGEVAPVRVAEKVTPQRRSGGDRQGTAVLRSSVHVAIYSAN